MAGLVLSHGKLPGPTLPVSPLLVLGVLRTPWLRLPQISPQIYQSLHFVELAPTQQPDFTRHRVLDQQRRLTLLVTHRIHEDLGPNRETMPEHRASTPTAMVSSPSSLSLSASGSGFLASGSPASPRPQPPDPCCSPGLPWRPVLPRGPVPGIRGHPAEAGTPHARCLSPQAALQASEGLPSALCAGGFPRQALRWPTLLSRPPAGPPGPWGPVCPWLTPARPRGVPTGPSGEADLFCQSPGEENKCSQMLESHRLWDQAVCPSPP